MKKNITRIKSLFTLLVLALGLVISSTETYACWAYLPVEELFEQADIILIGEVFEANHKSKGVYTDVKVDYYLKGNLIEGQITVNTPPENISTHYTLGNAGSRVLLFLYEDDEQLSPLSPQGVIKISLEENDIDKAEPISGLELVEQLGLEANLFEVLEEEKEEIISRISAIENVRIVDDKEIQEVIIVKPTDPSVADVFKVENENTEEETGNEISSKEEKNSSDRFWIYGLITLVGGVLIIIIKKTKGKLNNK